jgi:hypothetical protein
LAERNGSLIIESNTFLKLFEDYINQEKSEKEIWDLFESNIGLLLEPDIIDHYGLSKFNQSRVI